MEIVKVKTHISDDIPVDISDYSQFNNAIVGVFDFLGFKNKMSSCEDLKQFAGFIKLISNIVIGEGDKKTVFEYNDRVSELKPKILQIFDTFVIYSPNSEPQDIMQFLWNISQMLFNAIFFEFPMRRAIATGEIMINENKRIFIGEAILEAMEYERNQEWSGACLTESLEKYIESLKIKDILSPLVLEYNIPFKKNFSGKSKHAINWIADAFNFISPLFIKNKFSPFETGSSEENKFVNTKEFLTFAEKKKFKNGYFPGPKNRKVILETDVSKKFRFIRIIED